MEKLKKKQGKFIGLTTIISLVLLLSIFFIALLNKLNYSDRWENYQNKYRAKA